VHQGQAGRATGWYEESPRPSLRRRTDRRGLLALRPRRPAEVASWRPEGSPLGCALRGCLAPGSPRLGGSFRYRCCGDLRGMEDEMPAGRDDSRDRGRVKHPGIRRKNLPTRAARTVRRNVLDRDGSDVDHFATNAAGCVCVQPPPCRAGPPTPSGEETLSSALSLSGLSG
jgi:hypothetical protein